jgi:P-type Cu2+ transporter
VLAQQDIQSEMLTGDGPSQAARVASALNLTHLSSELTPAGKLARLKTLGDEGHKVLMIGDGLNDAPALAAAHVSMAPASASDIGRTAADFVFLSESLDAVITAHTIARRTRKIVKQNFGLAIAYNAFAVPLAMSGYLNPLIAAVAMSTSSLLVIANSLRLSDWQFLSSEKEGFETKEAIA